MKLDVWERIQDMFQRIESQLAEEVRKSSGLGVNEFRTLRTLIRQPKREMRMQELAEFLHLTQSSTTRLVERLEKRGFVYRDSCPSDGRGKYCVLTDEGRRYINKAIPALEATLESVLDSFFAAEDARSAVRELSELSLT
ncbi:MarR family winged helix-turn-helix transcriptional regulator [Rhodophyticola porphyridii]|uniref:MarR family winged helix-turn-helix transcriptional regulator n=1 Tax=Rhodophyticola porphyridii TaxID=1852017 RepID=UPI001B2A1B7D|nr:MarR family transcriptional regulator [Roseicyclus sp.]